MAASKRFFIHNDIFVSLVSISYNFERVDLTRTPLNVNDFRKAISIKGKYKWRSKDVLRYWNVIILRQQVKASIGSPTTGGGRASG